MNNVNDQIGETIIQDEVDEAKRLKGRELDDALYAALLSRSHSDQARVLVDTVTALVTEHEIAAGTRTNKRDKKKTALQLAVERLLADLLQAQASETNKGYVYRPLRPQGFTGQAVSYRTFKSLVETMLTLGLLESHKGFQMWDAPFGGALRAVRQKATRFRATQQLLEIFEQHGFMQQTSISTSSFRFLITHCAYVPLQGGTSTARRSAAGPSAFRSHTSNNET